MIDLHCRILFDINDGASTKDVSSAIAARASVAEEIINV